ncbi:transglycosylase domain-containing protein [Flavobacterium silvaticum]|uniref:Glycosyl transferase n=1 Tax=Flavobacterium silvaticum TaxID=1852020 RepID=A0A972JFQ2_9FLAO|nr:biosynthetic peptidoglycan transglycosylase [Flavobacterium silvaticum]NMH28214.1 glycosyl transferase [Flavobacterium silvaticum]
MSPRAKKRILIVLASLLTVIVLALAGILIFRDALLQKAIAKVSDKMRTDYESKFSVKNAHFTSLNSIEMKDIVLVPKSGDTLVSIKNFSTEVNLWKLFTGNLQLGKLNVSNGFVQLVKNKEGKNFDAFLHPKNEEKPVEKTPGERTNYAKLGYKLLTQALNLIPTDMQIDNVQLRLFDMDRKLTMDLSKLRLADKKFNSDIRVTTNTMAQNWNISGFADPREKQTDLRFFSRDSGGIRLPYVDERWNLKSGFDSIRLKVTDIDLDGDEMHVEGFSSITNLMVEHRRIASQPVVIKNADFKYKLMFGADFMQVDSSSTASLNKIKFHPFAQYNVEQDTIYKLRVNIPKMQAQDFITSLPDGLFTHFKGMEAEGAFDYNLVFEYNKNKPNKVVFNSSLHKEGLKIIKYGEANLAKLNGSFTYRAVENGRLQRPILVSPVNIYYTPLDQISPYLRKAVLTTEDPSFFSHRGFINDAFRQSIVQNIKTKRFARGASTISMQLIKNVFLVREKTLSRKLEEILLVYIMENNHIVSKNRMLEVYFNIIEWGPNVYGIGEASLFYFLKHPSELNLNESLFLASIVPKPKKFMWQFDGEATLKPYLVKHNSYLKNIMMRRGLISPEDTVAQTKKVVLYGSARNFVKKEKEEKTIDLDTLSIDEFDF